ncbi:MAG: FIST C-terminal domain-containing protein [Myxococcales bacterium]|nr:FIST C-terminal domain-containing protein [Myxococcales bacterium]MCB9716478.1 FIST C-terminal domain-containing protein [Myxococcales bacterium]
MRVEQRHWSADGGWRTLRADPAAADAQLVLLFGEAQRLGDERMLAAVRERHPRAVLSGCSTAGEIHDVSVTDDGLVTNAIRFDDGGCRLGRVSLAEHPSHRAAAEALAAQLPAEGLVHVLVFSEGLSVNGSELAAGLDRSLPEGVTVTGGLAGDGSRFGRTVTVADGVARSGEAVAVGLYGPRLRVGYGSRGGWDPFGPERVITRAEGSVLYELDGRPALDLYEEYLGEHAAGLPATGLLFPLMVRVPGSAAEGVVRTLVAIDEAARSVTFVGEMAQGHHARLMKANFDRLIDGAHGAADQALAGLRCPGAELALLVSCVGRRLVLRQRTEEELEAVREVLGPAPVLTGFYSYGEICPPSLDADCELHNQTMTVTTLGESDA